MGRSTVLSEPGAHGHQHLPVLLHVKIRAGKLQNQKFVCSIRVGQVWIGLLDLQDSQLVERDEPSSQLCSSRSWLQIRNFLLEYVRLQHLQKFLAPMPTYPASEVMDRGDLVECGSISESQIHDPGWNRIWSNCSLLVLQAYTFFSHRNHTYRSYYYNNIREDSCGKN